jgi:uncharacterized cupredoxin-like copper-binding protein
MKRQETRERISTALLWATLLVILPLLVACVGGKAKEEAPTVQVRVTDNAIEMPNPMPTGAVKFQITNAGTHEHSFGITGPVGDITLPQPLKPGETASLDEMFLDTGTYRVYCPVDEKHGEPMQIALNVRPEAPAATKNG